MSKLSLDMILNKNTKEEICKQYSKKLVSNDINDFKIGEPLDWRKANIEDVTKVYDIIKNY